MICAHGSELSTGLMDRSYRYNRRVGSDPGIYFGPGANSAMDSAGQYRYTDRAIIPEYTIGAKRPSKDR